MILFNLFLREFSQKKKGAIREFSKFFLREVSKFKKKPTTMTDLPNKKQKTEFPPRDGGYLFRTTFEDHAHLFQWWFDEKSTPEGERITTLLCELLLSEDSETSLMFSALKYLCQRSSEKTADFPDEEDFSDSYQLEWIRSLKNIKDVGEWCESGEPMRWKKLNNVTFVEFWSTD
jgi:hypothetical protein